MHLITGTEKKKGIDLRMEKSYSAVHTAQAMHHCASTRKWRKKVQSKSSQVKSVCYLYPSYPMTATSFRSPIQNVLCVKLWWHKGCTHAIKNEHQYGKDLDTPLSLLSKIGTENAQNSLQWAGGWASLCEEGQRND